MKADQGKITLTRLVALVAGRLCIRSMLVLLLFSALYVPSLQVGGLVHADSPGTWANTGSMAVARSDHTATLLQNGQVLVAGGSNGYTTIAGAELYNPATGTWAATGSMTSPRSGHTATLLHNGQVLVVGGYVAGVISSSAELYDPKTGQWTTTGSLNTARSNFTATLLPSGKVLVVGGTIDGQTNPGHILASAELYDPTTGQWTETGSLTYPREDHTATLLSDGQVLVVGGVSPGSSPDGYTNSAELYNPTTGTWAVTGNATYERYSQTATLLTNGEVLIAGGFYGPSALSSAELYNPVTGTWATTASMSTTRVGHVAVLLHNGQVLVAGGQDANHTILSSAELYDPTIGVWTSAGSMNAARYNPTVTLLPSGSVLVAGGSTNDGLRLSSAELYVSSTDSGCVTNCSLQTATPELGSGELLATGLLPIGAVLLYRRRRSSKKSEHTAA